MDVTNAKQAAEYINDWKQVSPVRQARVMLATLSGEQTRLALLKSMEAARPGRYASEVKGSQEVIDAVAARIEELMAIGV